jgi:hypothetical protein
MEEIGMNMESTYALVGGDGVLVEGSVTQVPILEVGPGQRISFRSATIYDEVPIPFRRHVKKGGCDAYVTTRKVSVSGSLCAHEISVLGTNPDELEKMIEYSIHLVETASIRFQLPEIKKFWKRIKFFYWDYLIHGRVEPKE